MQYVIKWKLRSSKSQGTQFLLPFYILVMLLKSHGGWRKHFKRNEIFNPHYDPNYMHKIKKSPGLFNTAMWVFFIWKLMYLRAKKKKNKKAKNEFLSDNLQFLYMLKCGAFTTVIYSVDFSGWFFSWKIFDKKFSSILNEDLWGFFCNFKIILIFNF